MSQSPLKPSPLGVTSSHRNHQRHHRIPSSSLHYGILDPIPQWQSFKDETGKHMSYEGKDAEGSSDLDILLKDENEFTTMLTKDLQLD